MDVRQKFLKVMNFEKNVLIPKTEFTYWAGTLMNWFDRGIAKIEDLPTDVLNS